jgi:hypothetical protein
VYFFADIFFFFVGKIIFSQRMPLYFDAAPAPKKIFDAALVILLYTKPTFWKQTKISLRVGAAVSSGFLND